MRATQAPPGRAMSSSRSSSTAGAATGGDVGPLGRVSSGVNSDAAVRSATVKRSPTRYSDGPSSLSRRSIAALTASRPRSAVAPVTL